MKAKAQKGKPAGSEPTPGPGADELPERRSVRLVQGPLETAGCGTE